MNEIEEAGDPRHQQQKPEIIVAAASADVKLIGSEQEDQYHAHHLVQEDEYGRGGLIMKQSGSSSINEIEEIAETSSVGPGKTIIRGGGGGGEGVAGRMSPVLEIGTTDTTCSSLFSLELLNGGRFNHHIDNEGGGRDEEVFVAVLDKGPTSMDALVWALKHVVINPSNALVNLIHVFPELKFVPSPLGHGKVSITQVKEDQVEYYLGQERSKRREILQSFINKCTAHRVKVETMLIEADEVADAIVELISVLHIQKLVVGVTRSSIRKLKARKGNGTAEKILQKGPEWCDIKFICEGKDVLHDDYLLAAVQSPRHRRSSRSSNDVDTPDVAAASFDHFSSKDNDDRQLSQRKDISKDFKAYCCFN